MFNQTSKCGVIKQFLFGLILCSSLILSSTRSFGFPETFALEMYLAISEDGQYTPLTGIYDVTFELIDPSGESVFSTTFRETITIGILQVELDGSEGLDPDIFSKNILTSKITISGSDLNTAGTQLNLGPSAFTDTEVIELPIHSLSNSVISRTSISADQFSIIDIIVTDDDLGGVAITTSNIQDQLHVDGIVHATNLAGNASGVDNIDYLIWNNLDTLIYYDEGNVGIGTNTPNAYLHVNDGTATFKQNLFISDTLHATFTGDAKEIYNFDASNVTTGNLAIDRLFGSYDLLSGVSTLNTGIWIASEIQNDYVSTNLTLNGARIFNSSLADTLALSRPLNIISNTYSTEFVLDKWSLAHNSKFVSMSANELEINELAIQSPSTINFTISSTERLSVFPDGHVGLNGNYSDAELELATGIKISNSANEAFGILRIGNTFEGYNDSGWAQIDLLGHFTGDSLFPEDEILYPALTVHASGNIGINTIPNDALTVYGNVIFLGDDSVGMVNDITSDGDYLIWAAGKGALRIGTSSIGTYTGDTLNDNDYIGNYSVSLGYNASAVGTGSISISNSELGKSVVTSGEYGVVIGSNTISNDSENMLIFSSLSISDTATNNVIFSSFQASVDGTNSFAFNGQFSNLNHDNSYIGGYITPSSIGTNSFVWDPVGLSRNFGSSYPYSFHIGNGMNVGINTNSPSNALDVNGAVSANYLVGSGVGLTGDFIIDHLTIEIDGEATDVYPTHNKLEYSVYVSDDNGYLPDDIVVSASVSDGSVTSDDLDSNIINSDHIMDGSLSTDDFADASIIASLLSIDDLTDSLFSNLDGSNFEDDSVTSADLAIPSIETEHFADEAVTTRHIYELDTIEGKNISNNSILREDMNDEALLSEKFATGSATGRNIADQALYTTLDGSGNVIDSYFVDGEIIERHINDAAVLGTHIIDDSIDSRSFGLSSVDTDDFSTTNDVIADSRTVSSAVFESRHFEDGSITTPKFSDPFYLTVDIIASGAVTSTEIADDEVYAEHFSDNSVLSEHIVDQSIVSEKFTNGAIVSASISEGSILSSHILNYTIQPIDISTGEITGDHIVDGAITSTELTDDAMDSEGVSNNAIATHLIIDKTLGSEDFAEGAFTSDKFSNSSVTSIHIIENGVQSDDLNENFVVSTNHFIDGSITWDDFIQPPNGYIPGTLFGDLESTHFESGNISTEKFATGAVTADDLVDTFTFSDDHLAAYLGVDKGGTGTGSFTEDNIIFSFDNGTETVLSQDNNFTWDPSNMQFKIGDFSGLISEAVSTTGNIFVEDGALILENYGNGTYQFIELDSDSETLFFTGGLDLDAATSNAGIRIADLYLENSLTIGGTTQKNNVDLYSGFSLGGTYITESPPSNGFIVESSLQVGFADFTDFSTYALYVGGIAGSFSEDIGITSILTDSSTPIVASLNTTTGISASGNIGIKTSGDNVAITVNVSEDAVGFHAIINSDSDTGAAIAADVQGGVISSSFISYMGYSSPEFKAGIYVTTPNTTKDNNYAAYFDGDTNFNNLTKFDTTPTENLRINTIYSESGLVIYKPQTGINLSIDWNNGNIVHLDMDDTPRTLTFTKPENSSRLLMKISHTGSGTITWPDNIKWHGLDSDESPELSIETVTDFVLLIYNESTDKYYGSVSYGFQ